MGGALVRRERGLSHLTELGRRLLPLFEQCHESALNARAVAEAVKAQKLAGLRLAMHSGVSVGPFADHLCELLRACDGLTLEISRGDAAETATALRNGDAALAIAEPDGMTWERFESWPLFREPIVVCFCAEHPFATADSVSPAALRRERVIVSRRGVVRRLDEALGAVAADVVATLEITEESDARMLVAAGAAVALAPLSAIAGEGVATARLEGPPLSRELRLFAVQGRRREPAAAMLATLLRAADWSDYALEAAMDTA